MKKNTKKRTPKTMKTLVKYRFIGVLLLFILVASGTGGIYIFKDLSGNVGISSASSLATDINNDNVVDILDLTSLLAVWGASGSTSAATVSIETSNNAYVDSARPTEKLGVTDPNILKADKDPSQMDIFLRFSLPDQNEAPITKAILKMKVVDGGTQYTSGAAYATSNEVKNSTTDRWFTNNLTWDNAPAAIGSPIFTHGPTVNAQIAEFNLTSYYNSPGLKSVRIVGSNASGVHYSSKTGGYAPVLEVTYGGGAYSIGDINKDGKVNIIDLSLLLGDWNKTADTTPTPPPPPTTPPPTTPPTTPGRPDATNTGVPAGTTLAFIKDKYASLNNVKYTVNSIGKVTITGSGTASSYLIFDGVYFPHGVEVKGNYIKITNSKIAAGRSSVSGMPRNPMTEAECKAYSGSGWALFINRNVAEITTNPQNSLIVEDSEIYIRSNKARALDGSAADGNTTDIVNGVSYNYTNDGPSMGMNAIQGRNATFKRVNVHGGIDGIGFNPRPSGESSGGVVVEDSYIHDIFKWPYSKGHGCRDAAAYPNNPYGTHADAIQIHGMGDFVIRRNNIVANPLALNVEVQESAYADGLTTTYDKYITSRRTGSDGKVYIRWKPLNGTGIESNGKGQKVTIDSNHFEYGTCSINVAAGISTGSSVTKNIFWGKNGPYADQFKGNACAINANGLSIPTTGTSVNKWSDGAIITDFKL